VSGRERSIRGVGRQVNPLDGDAIDMEVSVRGGKIAAIGSPGIRMGRTVVVGDVIQSELWFKSGAEARALGGETFAGCETARRAALVLADVFIGREVEDAFAVEVRDVIARMDGDALNESCITTVLAAVRRALIDAQVTALAEATVEARTLRGHG
jgi:hypothetical protein